MHFFSAICFCFCFCFFLVSHSYSGSYPYLCSYSDRESQDACNLSRLAHVQEMILSFAEEICLKTVGVFGEIFDYLYPSLGLYEAPNDASPHCRLVESSFLASQHYGHFERKRNEVVSVVVEENEKVAEILNLVFCQENRVALNVDFSLGNGQFLSIINTKKCQKKRGFISATERYIPGLRERDAP